jgi:hypothetical protein
VQMIVFYISMGCQLISNVMLGMGLCSIPGGSVTEEVLDEAR